MTENAKRTRSEAMKAKWLDPDYRERRNAALRLALAKVWTPEHRAKMGRLAAERLVARHRDNPEFREKLHSAKVAALKIKFSDPAFREYYRELGRKSWDEGKGIATPEAKRKKAIAAKWIITRCERELWDDTDFKSLHVRKYAEYSALEPYDEAVHGDHPSYLSTIGKRVCADPEYRRVHDEFIGSAYPRWAEEWRKRKAAGAQGVRASRPNRTPSGEQR